MTRPVLYSFRRCPYAMRARLAISSAEIGVELREVVLRDKPEEMIEISPKATVPVLLLPDDRVIDESLDVMHWALSKSDPEKLRAFDDTTLQQIDTLVVECDGPFKSALDRYKYPNRYEDIVREDQRDKGAQFVQGLNQMLDGQAHLFGDRISFADLAILPFVRQFAHVDQDWFWSQDWKNAIRWLDVFKESTRFKSIMTKYDQWESGEDGVEFGV